ncbi:IS1381 transposase orf A [Streptococcus pneumoniae]|nr:IS1381 transposase orf A [Streptococcus pneumoniae]
MNDEASKQLTDARFKRLVGVQRTTFEEMLAVFLFKVVLRFQELLSALRTR